MCILLTCVYVCVCLGVRVSIGVCVRREAGVCVCSLIG